MMTDRRFWITSLVVFLIWWVGAFLINGMLLMDDWIAQASFIRGWDSNPNGLSELQLYHYMIIPYVIYAIVTVWFYAHMVKAASWTTQGLKFGLALVFITVVPMRMLNYTTFAFTGGGLVIPSPVIVKEVVYWTIMLLVIGLTTAWFYRDAPARVR